MIKSLAIALLFVVCVSSFKDSRAILTEIDQSHFGNAMMSAIQLNLASKAPSDEIIILIDQIIENLEDKQAKAEKQNATNSKDCQDTLLSLNAQIAETKGNNKKLGEAIADNTEIIKTAVSDLQEARQDYDETIQSIETGTAERVAAHQKWANEDYDQTIQITTLDEGTKLINHMLHGVAFAQVEQRYEKVLESLKNSKGVHAGLFKPLVTQLTQLATKLNYENVMNILKLLSDIRASIVQAQNEARKDEETAQATWEKRLKSLEAQKKQLSDKKIKLANLISSTQKVVDNDKKSLANGVITLENLEQSLTDKENQCAAWSKQYAETSAEIERELGILNQLRAYVTEKQTQVKDYAAARKANRPQ